MLIFPSKPWTARYLEEALLVQGSYHFADIASAKQAAEDHHAKMKGEQHG